MFMNFIADRMGRTIDENEISDAELVSGEKSIESGTNLPWNQYLSSIKMVIKIAESKLVNECQSTKSVPFWASLAKIGTIVVQKQKSAFNGLEPPQLSAELAEDLYYQSYLPFEIQAPTLMDDSEMNHFKRASEPSLEYSEQEILMIRCFQVVTSIQELCTRPVIVSYLESKNISNQD
jgi:hypothetical protein